MNPETNIQPERRLRPNWLVWSLLSALILGIGYWGMQLASAFILQNVCPSGLGGLGCSLVLYFGTLVLSICILLAGGVVLLRRLVFHAWHDAVGTIVPVAVGAVCALRNAAFFMELLGDDGLTAGYLLIPVAFVVFMVAAILISIALMRTSRQYGWLIAGIVTSLLMVAAAYGLNSLGYQLNIAQENKKEVDQVEKADFDLYQPRYIVDGYHLYSHTFHEAYSEEDEPYYEFSYLYGDNDLGDPSPYSIYISHVSKFYAPPANCGSVAPILPPTADDLPEPCTLIGTSKAGCTVYFTAPDYTSEADAYCRIGETLVTFEAGVDDDQVRQHAKIMKIFDSLQPASIQELQKQD